jgi:hypothetical protein
VTPSTLLEDTEAVSCGPTSTFLDDNESDFWVPHSTLMEEMNVVC